MLENNSLEVGLAWRICSQAPHMSAKIRDFVIARYTDASVSKNAEGRHQVTMRRMFDYAEEARGNSRTHHFAD